MIRLTPERIVAPGERLISTAAAKSHLNVHHSDHDGLIAAMVEVVEQHLDGWGGVVGKALITQTWRDSFSCFPSGWLGALSVGPVQSIEGVRYYADGGSSLTVVDPGTYRVVKHASGIHLELVDGESWPDGLATRSDCVQVTYVAGYGDAAADVPAPIVQAAKLLLGDLYENRETFVVGQADLRTLPTVAALLSSHRRPLG